MAIARKKNGFGRTAARAGAVLATIGLGATLTVSSAFAADSPSNAELIRSCNNGTSQCSFHPQSWEYYTGPSHQVSDLVYNCGSETNQYTIGWEDTTESSDSVGVAVSVGAGFQGVFEAAIEASYSHTWTVSHTDNATATINVPSAHVGWINRGAAKQQASGWWEMHYDKPFYGHYIWFVKDYKESGPHSGSVGTITFQNRAMTSSERNQHGC